MANSTVTGIPQAQQILNQIGIDYGQNFNKEVSNRARRLAQKIQADINKAIAGGPVAFTQRAVFFRFYRTASGQAVNEISIRPAQAAYLYDVIVKPDNISKLIPTSAARLTKQGNISGLRAGLKSGKYIVVDSGGKKRLIDKTKKDTKKKTKRVIGMRATKKRKMVFDFYTEAEAGARLILAGVQGHFRLGR